MGPFFVKLVGFRILVDLAEIQPRRRGITHPADLERGVPRIRHRHVEALVRATEGNIAYFVGGYELSAVDDQLRASPRCIGIQARFENRHTAIDVFEVEARREEELSVVDVEIHRTAAPHGAVFLRDGKEGAGGDTVRPLIDDQQARRTVERLRADDFTAIRFEHHPECDVLQHRSVIRQACVGHFIITQHVDGHSARFVKYNRCRSGGQYVIPAAVHHRGRHRDVGYR